MDFEFDLIVIGAGSGGVRASRLAAAAGKKVVVCEDREPGGTCVNVGCVPKKLFHYAAHFHRDFEDSRAYGWDLQVKSFDWATLRNNKTKEIERLNRVYIDLLEKSGVTFAPGRARLVDQHTVMVGDRALTGAHILVATGGRPFMPDVPGIEHAVSSDQMFYLDSLPGEVVVIGGGYIAVEFAGILSGLGVKVTLVNRTPGILKAFDRDIADHLQEEMEKDQIQFVTDGVLEGISKKDSKFAVHLKNGSKIETDLVLMATGRIPNTQGLGLEAIGIDLGSNGAIKVNERFRTSVSTIYAIGDVIGRVQLTPVAIAEAHCVVDDLYGKGDRRMSYELIPSAVFSQPPIGTVGLSEEAAIADNREIVIFRSRFRVLKDTLTGRQEFTLMKLVVDKKTNRVLGLHMVGPDAAEMTQGFAVAMRAGATKEDFDRTVGIHPTAAEEFVTMREPV